MRTSRATLACVAWTVIACAAPTPHAGLAPPTDAGPRSDAGAILFDPTSSPTPVGTSSSSSTPPSHIEQSSTGLRDCFTDGYYYVLSVDGSTVTTHPGATWHFTDHATTVTVGGRTQTVTCRQSRVGTSITLGAGQTWTVVPDGPRCVLLLGSDAGLSTVVDLDGPH